ncbi:tRNA(m(1)G37)methyltransferase [Clydaea vesicula]|uniref:tRNA (guanine(37)-N1)-methyltransferase n=1 Tax=Clydaea vesicula TaxID=447962 RepID=A0AAD5U1C5_9FUNG|nr:tRNA(m(1)G37)methyltransferase [Clydaea vesicula]
MATIKSLILNIKRKSSIVNYTPEPSSRLVLINRIFDKLENFKNFSNEKITNFLKETEASVTNYDLNFDYDYFTVDQILKSILPDELSNEIPSSFETIGHIAHLNLRDQYKPFKFIIGQVILDKMKNIRTVVNKLDNIDHTFRFFKMELLAGDNIMNAEVKESGCTFKLDFSKVYWNSRLQMEHDRLILKNFKRNDVICDVMAGIGPFSIPSAKNVGALVFANDLNPNSFESLNENIKLNKVAHKVKCFNLDGRIFIKESILELNKEELIGELRENFVPTKTARVKDTDAFRGLLTPYKHRLPKKFKLPIIHCYCFSTEVDNLEADVIERCSKALGYKLTKADILNFHRVRDVAPRKEMVCISFTCPEPVLFLNNNEADNTFDHEAKKIKI